jgi:hypothetical protein
MTYGPHRRRVKHVRARLRERIGVQARALEVTLIDGRLARGGHETWVNGRLERATCRTQTIEDLGRGRRRKMLGFEVQWGGFHIEPARRTRFRRRGAPWRSRQNPLPFVCGRSPFLLSSCSIRSRTATRFPRLAGRVGQSGEAEQVREKGDVRLALQSPLCIATARFDGYLQSAAKA